MTGAEFIDIHSDVKLREYVVDIVKAFTADIGRRAHFLCIAWIAIGNANYGMLFEHYLWIAYSTIRRDWEKRWMPKPKRYPSDDSGTRRAGRIIKKVVE